MELKCPICKSHRIRKGYRPTSFWSMIIMRFNLLCDSCNWEFAAFALPWTIPTKPSRKSKFKKSRSNTVEEHKDPSLAQTSAEGNTVENIGD